MADCSVQNLSVWSPRFQSSYEGVNSFSVAKSLPCKVESILTSDILNRRVLGFTIGQNIMMSSKKISLGLFDCVGTTHSNLQNHHDRGTFIPGLHNDVAKLIMALAPQSDLPNMGCVSKSWQAFLKSKEFYKIRTDMGTAEEWIYALTLSEDRKRNCLRSISPVQNVWKTLAPMPGSTKGGSGFAVVDGKLLIIGGALEGSGPSAVADVLLYNTSLNRWQKGASMHDARFEFACAVLNGLVYVVGGRGSGGKKLATAEVYDPEQDRWTKLPSLRRPRWGCLGCGLEGKLYVMAGRSSFTIGHSRFVDVFDPSKGQWEAGKSGCMVVLAHAVVGQELFCIEWKHERKLAVFNAAQNSWKSVPLPLAGSVNVGFYMTSIQGKLLLFPTSAEARCETLMYDPKASLGNEWEAAELRPCTSLVHCATIVA